MKSLKISLLILLIVAPMFSVVVAVPKDFTISQASWLNGWRYRQTYNITGATGASTDFQIFVNVTYHSYMETDFDDLRFTDNDGTTLLDAWLEDKTDSSFACVWVEVADSLATDTQIYLYFGNSTVSDYWDGPATFEFFDDFEDNSLNTTLWRDFGANPVVESGGELAFLGGTTETESQGTFGFPKCVGFYAVWWDVRSMGFGDATPFDKECYIDTFTGDGRLYCRTNANTATDTFTDDQTDWHYVEVWWINGSYAEAWVDDVEVSSVSNAYVPDNDMYLFFYVYGPDNEYLSMDHVYVRELATGETQPSVVLAESWEIFGHVTLIIDVNDPVIEWGFDLFLIIVGMVMIPSSVLYFVKGGTKEASMQKGYYFIIMFMIGWALLIGGVMP